MCRWVNSICRETGVREQGLCGVLRGVRDENLRDRKEKRSSARNRRKKEAGCSFGKYLSNISLLAATSPSPAESAQTNGIKNMREPTGESRRPALTNVPRSIWFLLSLLGGGLLFRA